MSDDLPEKKKEGVLPPIEEVVKELLDQGYDKYEQAAQLKIQGYKYREIAKITGVSQRDIGKKLSAAENGNPLEAISTVADTNTINEYMRQVNVTSLHELAELITIRQNTKSYDNRAKDRGFESTADYIKAATNFYDSWKPYIDSKFDSGEVGLIAPIISS